MTASLRIELFPADLDVSVDFYVSVLGIEVDDVTVERDRVVAAGGKLADDLVARPWGLTDFRLYDPDGNYWRVTGT